MKISKSKGKVLLSSLKQNELFALLKCQIICDIVFSDVNNTFIAEKTISLGNRTLLGKLQMIEANDVLSKYKDLISNLSTIMQSGLILSIAMEVQEFKKNEPLITILSSIKEVVVDSAISIEYNNGVFLVINKPFANGDNDKLYFYESNNTILAFVETGPVLITDNNNISSIMDVLCN